MIARTFSEVGVQPPELTQSQVARIYTWLNLTGVNFVLNDRTIHEDVVCVLQVKMKRQECHRYRRKQIPDHRLYC